jgi:DNA-binding MarR family transcriptional regulator
MAVDASEQLLSDAGLRGLGEIEQRLGYRMHRLDLLHLQMLRDRLDAIGLTPARASALAFVRTNPGAGQSDLARALDINRASAMEMVNLLTGIDAIERREGRNPRIHALHITPSGEALYARFIAATIENDRLITANLSPAEHAEFARLTDLMARALQEHLSTTITTVS